MNILLDRLPVNVEVDGHPYKIRTDFRISVMFELMMFDPEVPENQKLAMAFNLYYEELPGNFEEACNQMLWFYKCGKEDNAYTKKLAEKKAQRKERIYSFDHDDQYIFAAFLQQYGVDLNKAHMHWWKFRAMFNGLTDKCEFVKIMGYRAKDITNDMSKSEKAFYRKMKKIYEIPLSKTEEDKQDAIEQALMKGGDLAGLL